jgi:hypothetical protein
VALRDVPSQHEESQAQEVEAAQIGQKVEADELPAPWVAVAVVVGLPVAVAEADWEDSDRTSRALHADLSTGSCRHHLVAALAGPVVSYTGTDRSRHRRGVVA